MIDIDAADEITIDTTSADGHIAITSAHTAGQSILISANADAGSILDIDAGIIDIDIQAGITLDATTISIDGTDDSNLTVTGSGKDLDIAVAGGGTQELRIASAGTGASAVSIDASAGGVNVDAAATKDVNIAGGQVALVSKDDAASAISLTANQGTSETIVVTNTQGTTEGAIALTATAGGVDIDAAAAKDVNIAGGQVALVSKDDTASAISLTANQGTSETIVVTNTQGTAEGAIALTATAGGVDIDAAAAKDVNIAGGQVALVSKDDAASAISLTANQGTSETIVVTNTQGTAADAIALTATAGGITLNGSLVTKVNTLTVANTSALDPHQLIATTNNTVFLDLTDSDGTDNAVIEVTGSNTAGQHLNLFFDNAGSNTLQLDFGASTLASGSGLARYLKFSQTGQSASLMYVGSKWRIINTGAAVS